MNLKLTMETTILIGWASEANDVLFPKDNEKNVCLYVCVRYLATKCVERF